MSFMLSVAEVHYAKCCYAECRLCLVPFMLSVANKLIMLNVVMLSVVMLNVMAPLD